MYIFHLALVIFILGGMPHAACATRHFIFEEVRSSQTHTHLHSHRD